MVTVIRCFDTKAAISPPTDGANRCLSPFDEESEERSRSQIRVTVQLPCYGKLAAAQYFPNGTMDLSWIVLPDFNTLSTPTIQHVR
jgi:hypothetical protein